ncbi:hypothetical protein GCM10010348_62430 [Streptomyces anthocyanicus]|uniref:hypothetical protein n=1 Tax=Streptomyces anthocyanicus TaxID=68174 RepID=UPI0018742F9E|nr:hypothetical protein [Streptomyces anthocyanicus]GHC27817.1 hypothetical protein GCM10010348_62430 [Streptomyces anthocyanicus]
MSPQVELAVRNLTNAMESGSAPAYQEALHELAETARAEGTEGLSAAVAALAPLLSGLGGDFAMTAILAGACVEWGASPTPLIDVLPARAAEAMMLNATVPELWKAATGGRPLPEPESASADELVRELTRRPWWRRTTGRAREEALTRIALSWFDMEDWLKALNSVMVEASFRVAVSDEVKAELREHAASVADRSQRAVWVSMLAAVLDNESFVVIDARTRRGYSLTMSGIGSNGQLHILLADRLIGDQEHGLVAGPPPASRWVEAATSGDPQLGAESPAMTSFELLDGYGRLITPDGAPADIEALDGMRILVMQPVGQGYAMTAGRTFERMKPALNLDRILPQAETERWIARLPSGIM